MAKWREEDCGEDQGNEQADISNWDPNKGDHFQREQMEIIKLNFT